MSMWWSSIKQSDAMASNSVNAHPDPKPPSSTLVPSSPKAGATPIPGVRRYRQPNRDLESNRDGDFDDSEGEEMDPNEFDLMVSRSFQSPGPMLEPESYEHSMLRNTRRRSRHRSSSRRHRSRGGSALRHSSLGTDLMEPADDKQNGAVDEETPLLPSASSASLSPSQDDLKRSDDNPYLGGVTVTQFWMLFTGIMMTFFISCFDSTIMASSHPVITSYFGSSNSASWLSTAFLLTSTAFQPLLGGLSDAIGRKIPYLVTMVLFLVSTVWCALAQSIGSFIVARAVCGLGAGGMMALAGIIISDLVPIE